MREATTGGGVKKTPLADPVRQGQPRRADLPAAGAAPAGAPLRGSRSGQVSLVEFGVAARVCGLRGGLVVRGGGREGARALRRRGRSERGAFRDLSPRRGAAAEAGGECQVVARGS